MKNQRINFDILVIESSWEYQDMMSHQVSEALAALSDICSQENIPVRYVKGEFDPVKDIFANCDYGHWKSDTLSLFDNTQEPQILLTGGLLFYPRVEHYKDHLEDSEIDVNEIANFDTRDDQRKYAILGGCVGGLARGLYITLKALNKEPLIYIDPRSAATFGEFDLNSLYVVKGLIGNYFRRYVICEKVARSISEIE